MNDWLSLLGLGGKGGGAPARDTGLSHAETTATVDNRSVIGLSGGDLIALVVGGVGAVIVLGIVLYVVLKK